MPTPSIKIQNVDGILCKRCPQCSRIKPLAEFNADKSKKCGYSVQCKPCCRVKFARYYQNNKEKERINSKKWREDHREYYLAYNKKYRVTIECGFAYTKCQAKKRELDFDFTFDQYRATMAPNCCHYCEGPLNQTGAKLDRKDSAKGYTFDNCVPCCLKCNLIRGEDNISYLEMIEVSKLLKQLRSKQVGLT